MIVHRRAKSLPRCLGSRRTLVWDRLGSNRSSACPQAVVFAAVPAPSLGQTRLRGAGRASVTNSYKPMFFKLLAAFILIPLIELYLLLQVAQYTSVGMTILLVVLTGVIGSYLARREGAMAWFRFHSAVADGRMPSREIQDGLMIVFAGALLLTPGLLTDVLGFTLLTPVGREWIRKIVVNRYLRRFDIRVTTGDLHPDPLHRVNRGDAKTIDAEAVRRRPSSSS